MNPVGPRALRLLIRSLDAADSRIVADHLDPDEQEALTLLRDHGAMVLAADVPAVLCPWCGEHDVAPQRRAGKLQALCPECGYVTITNLALQAWTADPDWVLGRLRGAFGVAARQTSRALVPDTLWQVGQPTCDKRKHRILFARRLAQNNVQQDLRAALRAVESTGDVVLIGTTTRAATRLEGLMVPYLELPEIVHWRSGALVPNNESWNQCLRTISPPPHPDDRDGVSGDFRSVVIDGETFSFSVRQAQVLAYLDQARGEKCHKDSIMAAIGSPQKNPVELFRHNEKQYDGFQRLVAYDEHGHYRLKRR